MFKKILCILSLTLSLPAFSGEYNKALKNNEFVMLYLYTQKCSYCVKFDPIYQKVAKIYDSKVKFVKIDANTEEGYVLMKNLGVRFVPLVLLSNTKKNKAELIEPNCLLSYACVEKEINNFIK